MIKETLMHEDFDVIIKNGFKTWSRNIIIAVPFLLNMITTILFSFFAIFIFMMIFMMPHISSSTISDDITSDTFIQIFQSITQQNLLLLLIVGICIIFIFMFISTFFEAGAIGMSKVALIKGDTNLSDMWQIAIKNVFKLLLANILIILIVLAGFILFVPAILFTNVLSVNQTPSSITIILILMGLIIWIGYVLLATIFLFFTKYALVVDNLDPISAVEKSIQFVKNNLVDTVLMILLTISINIFIQAFDYLLSPYGDFFVFITFFISLLIVQPLTTVWITRMYMNRNRQDLYSFEQYRF